MNARLKRRIIHTGKISAAFHEAGHAITMMHYGGRCSLSMEPRLGVDIMEESAWDAKCHFRPHFLNVNGQVHLHALSAEEKAAVSVAGALAQCLYNWREYGFEWFDDFIESVEDWQEFMSATDLNGLSASDPAAIEKVGRAVFPILIQKWPAVDAVARKFALWKSLTDYQVWQVYEKFSRAE